MSICLGSCTNNEKEEDNYEHPFEPKPEEVVDSVLEDIQDIGHYQPENAPFSFVNVSPNNEISVAMVMDENNQKQDLKPSEKAIHLLVWELDDVSTAAYRARRNNTLMFTKMSEEPSSQNPYYKIDVHAMYPTGIPIKFSYQIHNETMEVLAKNRLTGLYEPI